MKHSARARALRALVLPRFAALAALALTAACQAPAPRGWTAAQDLSAGPVPPMAVRGRHALRIRAGLMDWSVDSDTSAGSTTTESGSDGFVGSLAYDYFVRQDLAVGISAGVLDSRTSTSVGIGGTTSESATVVPVLFGVTYYPERLAIRPNLRPYVSLSAGPYLGSATNSEVGSTVASESVSDVALGLRAMAGVDWFASRHTVLGIELGYHFVSDFDERIGSSDDYSGLEVSIGLGYLFGKGS